MRRVLITLSVALSFVLPLSAGALSIDELQSQLGSLLSQITTLQSQIAQLNASTSTISSTSANPAAPQAQSCPNVARGLGVGSHGADVASLQRYLIASGMLSSDAATGYFGSLTEAAVQAWQRAHGIVSSGSASTTGWGFIGSKTRAAMARDCGGSVIPSSDTVSVKLIDLSATANVVANTTSSCAARTFTLDWGDGTTPATLSTHAGDCAPIQATLSHDYASEGTYLMALVGPGYKTGVPITVTKAPTTCVAPSIFTAALPTAQVGVSWSDSILTTAGTTSVSAVGLPAGITIAPDTSATAGGTWSLRGVPTTAGGYSLAITAVNMCGSSQATVPLAVVASSTPATTTALCAVVNCAPGYRITGPACGAQACVAN